MIDTTLISCEIPAPAPSRAAGKSELTSLTDTLLRSLRDSGLRAIEAFTTSAPAPVPES